jgi:hypothetical protein
VAFALLFAAGAQIGRLFPVPSWIQTGSPTLSTFVSQPGVPPPHGGGFREVWLVLSAAGLGGAAMLGRFRRLIARAQPTASATDAEQKTTKCGNGSASAG